MYERRAGILAQKYSQGKAQFLSFQANSLHIASHKNLKSALCNFRFFLFRRNYRERCIKPYATYYAKVIFQSYFRHS